MARTATIERLTGETRIRVELDLDGQGRAEINTGIPFLDHMLTQIARHALFDISLTAQGDLEVDFHHTVEDVGICLGKAFAQAWGDRKGLTRFGEATIPLDESLSRVVVDLSNRPHLVWRVSFAVEKIGNFDTELLREWFAAFASNGGLTLHVENLYGINGHHVAESCFKALARALRTASTLDPRAMDSIPSTKGTLST